MKGLFYFLVLLFIGAIVASVMKMDFDARLFSQDNFYQWLTIAASICGLLLTYIFMRYEDFKERLNHRD